MAHFSYLSYHAQKRAAQRTALRGDEIASILNAGLAVDAGCMPGFNKRHWLFYSAPDDACYVAVQDTLTGTVLTILPLNYQERLAWKIDDVDCERAREIYLRRQQISTGISESKPAASVLVVVGHYVTTLGRQKSVTLLTCPGEAFGNDPVRYLRESDIAQILDGLVESKGISAAALHSISVKLGRSRHAPGIVVELQRVH